MGRTSKNKNRRKMTSKKKSKITNKRRQRRERQKGGMKELYSYFLPPAAPEQEEEGQGEGGEWSGSRVRAGWDGDMFISSATILKEIEDAEKLIYLNLDFNKEGNINVILKKFYEMELYKCADSLVNLRIRYSGVGQENDVLEIIKKAKEAAVAAQAMENHVDIYDSSDRIPDTDFDQHRGPDVGGIYNDLKRRIQDISYYDFSVPSEREQQESLMAMNRMRPYQTDQESHARPVRGGV